MSSAAHFEARKWAYRQTKEGTVVSFLIHPNDLNSDFAVADLGTRYMVAFAKIGDDEKPIAESSSQGQHPSPAGDASKVSSANLPKRKFHELRLSEQAALKCGDAEFQRWLRGAYWGQLVRAADYENTPDVAAAIVLRRVCGVKSRSEFDTNIDAGTKWVAIHDRFLTETGRMAEQR